jgi:hypothetical protein
LQQGIGSSGYQISVIFHFPLLSAMGVFGLMFSMISILIFSMSFVLLMWHHKGWYIFVLWQGITPVLL